MSAHKRAVIFANGILNDDETIRAAIHPDDLLIAADGGAAHCLALGLTPKVVIGDFDSLDKNVLAALQSTDVEVIRYPARKDETDLELAFRYARNQNVSEILVFAALGARWDMTIANLLLPAQDMFAQTRTWIVDGSQKITLVRAGTTLELHGNPGDTVSLIPLGGDVHGISSEGLEYPLQYSSLRFGSPLGVSNVLLGNVAMITITEGILMCILVD